MWGRRFQLAVVILMLICMASWVVLSAVQPVATIRVGMTEQEVEAAVGKPDMRKHDPGRGEFGVYQAATGWLLGRHDVYLVTYGEDGRVAEFDLIEHDFGRSRSTHH
jgi:hypothetical protein